MAKKPALGKGLSAILGDIDELYENELSSTSLKEEVDLDKIKVNPAQPRQEFKDESIEELASSIKEYGLIQPVIIQKQDDGYLLIAGERRLRACKLLGQKSIRAIINDEDEERLGELALIENIQREDLNPLDLANAYKELLDKRGLTQEELAVRMHKSRSEIANSLRILKLSNETKELILEGKLSKGHAKSLVGLKEDDEKKLSKEIIKENLSVRQAEERAVTLRNKEKSKLNLEYLSKKLGSLGVKASFKGNKIILEFKNNEEVENFSNLFKSSFK